jgi:hypothetical protein
MSVSAQTVDPINELFVRLNRSKPLTGAEIRNAMSGPVPEVIRLIAKHHLFLENVYFDVKRAQDQNAAAKVLLFEHAGRPSETKKINLDKFVEDHTGIDKKGIELVGRRVLDVLDDMTEIFLPNDPLLGSAGVFPVYYWLVKNTPSSRYHQIRDFLVNFERSRRENRELVIDNPKNSDIDADLTRFDEFNRSTNDGRSHEGRYDLLKNAFSKFVAAKK